jgi:hypothetical protein
MAGQAVIIAKWALEENNSCSLKTIEAEER